jgi:hypothetical protein
MVRGAAVDTIVRITVVAFTGPDPDPEPELEPDPDSDPDPPEPGPPLIGTTEYVALGELSPSGRASVDGKPRRRHPSVERMAVECEIYISND